MEYFSLWQSKLQLSESFPEFTDASSKAIHQEEVGSDSARFGLVYLDYCSRLTAGYMSIEKCPQADIEALFKYRCLSLTGSVLAVCFCRSELKTNCEYGRADDESINGDRTDEVMLLDIVSKFAQKSGYTSVHLQDYAREYGIVLVRIFSVSCSSFS
jgi:hypothetical protein